MDRKLLKEVGLSSQLIALLSVLSSDNTAIILKSFPAQLQFGNIWVLPRIIMLFHTTMSELFINTNSLSFQLLCF